jgi:hypothetical protein
MLYVLFDGCDVMTGRVEGPGCVSSVPNNYDEHVMLSAIVINVCTIGYVTQLLSSLTCRS